MSLINPYVVGFIVCASILLLGIAILIRNISSDHKAANNILSLGMVVMAIEGLIYGIYYSSNEMITEWPVLFAVGLLPSFISPPIIYFYVRNCFRVTYDHDERMWMHFLPVVVAFILMIPIIFGSHEHQLGLVKWYFGYDGGTSKGHDNYYLASLSILTLMYLWQMVYYAKKIFDSQRHYLRYMENIFSDTHPILATWSKHVAIFMAIYAGFVIVEFLIYFITGTTRFYNFDAVYVSIFYIYVALMAVKHSYLFTPEISNNLVQYKGGSSNEKYQTSGLSKEEANTIKLNINELMETDKPYLSPEFTVNHLTKMLNLARSQLTSEVLNIHMGENFYQLINRHRIEEAKRIMEEQPNRYTATEIGLKVGFNSNSAFYRHFKIQTGQAPKAYIKELQILSDL